MELTLFITPPLTLANPVRHTQVAKQAHIYDLVQMGHVEGRDNAIELIFMRDETMLFEIKFASIPSASIEQSVGLSVLFTIQCARMQIR